MGEKRFLTREEILQVQDLPVEDVHVPEWGGWVRVRGLTAEERDRLEASILEGQGKHTRVKMENVRAKLVAMTVVDEEGNRLFTDEDVAALAKKSATAMQRVFDVAMRLSGLTEEAMEELAKN